MITEAEFLWANKIKSLINMITKEEFLAAKKIVDEYNKQQETISSTNLKALENELKEFFKTNKLCHGHCQIKEFYLDFNWINKDRVDIFCVNPTFDEDYSESEEMEKKLNEIGKKYGFVNCSMESGAYGK